MDWDRILAALGGLAVVAAFSTWLANWRSDGKHANELEEIVEVHRQETIDADHEQLHADQTLILAKVEELVDMHSSLTALGERQLLLQESVAATQKKTLVMIGEVTASSQLMAQTCLWLVQIQNPDAPIPPQLQRLMDKTG